MPPRKSTNTCSTRDAVYAAAAAMFSARGFDGVSMDDVAKAASVNKAMIYYHFADKLTLYRAVVGDGLKFMGDTVGNIASSAASSTDTPQGKLNRFIEAFVRMTEIRPWMPAIMMREIAEGAPHLDLGTLVHMRAIIVGFGSILKQGQDAGVFRPIHPILAYASVIAPIILNAARERVAAQPGRQDQNLPMLVTIPHEEVIAHAQETARRMLKP